MFSRRSHHQLLATVALAMVAACSSATGPGADDPPAKLDKPPRALSGSEVRLVGAVNGFSFDLFRRLSAAQKDSNVFTSPLSASMALGMAMQGAAGPTYDQMRATLGFGSATDQEIGESYKSLIALLRGLDPAVDVRIANSIWYAAGFPFTQSFLDAGKNWFDAQVTSLDFTSPSAPTTINSWVSGATAGKIPTILDRIEDGQVMFLINAIYFKGSWREKFDPAQTRDAQFRGVAGSQPMKLMHRHGTVASLRTQDFAAVDLPYGNSAYTMTVVLPHEGKSVDAVAASLGAADWATWMSQFHEGELDVELPRFRLEWERMLIPDLQALGMRDAFLDRGADFTRMSPRGRELFISVVKQKTYVDVNEEGTEAAAVTNVGISLTSAPVPFRVDRPFVFVIRERLTGTVVFMGKIVRMP
jgi:serine protease inhibitor